MVKYIPDRGHFIRLNFDPQARHEHKGNKPVLVVSQTSFNRKMGLIFVCPISNTQRQNPFYVPIPESQMVTGVIMADQLRSLDYCARDATFICECAEDLLGEVLKRIKPILFEQDLRTIT